MTKEIMMEIVGNRRIYTFIETGLGDGSNAKQMKEIFDIVHTIELSKKIFDRVYKNLKDSGIIFHLGDSPKVLEELCAIHTKECVFYLDAHYCPGYEGDAATENPFPLWDELDVLKRRKQSDIICIDDIHCFGAKKGWESCTKESIEEYMNDGRTFLSKAFKDCFVLYRRESMDVH